MIATKFQLTPRRSNYVRLAVGVLFVCIVTVHGITSQGYIDYYGAVERTIVASNAGHYFQMSNLDPDRPHVPFEETLEYGEAILISLNAMIGRALLGSNYEVSSIHIYFHLLGLFVLLAGIFLLPDKPLILSITGVGVLLLAIVLGPLGFKTSRFWGPAYAALLISNLAVGFLEDDFSYWRILSLILSGLLIGFSIFLRQSSLGIIQVFSIVLSIFGILIVLAGRYVLRSWLAVWQVLRPKLVSIVMVLASMQLGIIIVNFVVRLMYSLALSTPLAQTKIVKHGLGHPIYLGLGYISNPYNIAWSDPIGAIHASLRDPTVALYDDRYQSFMFQEWFDIVTRSPWLLLENGTAKLLYLHTLLRGGFAPFPEQFQISNQPLYLIPVYFFALLFLMAAIVLVVRKPTLNQLLIVISFTGILLGALASPLITHPGMAAGVQGAILSTGIVLPVAFYKTISLDRGSTDRSQDRAIAKQTIIYAGIFLGSILLVVSIWYLWRLNHFHKEQESLLQADPLERLEELGYQYEAIYNTLPLENQLQILDELRDTDSSNIAVLQSKFSNPHFGPELMVITSGQLHLFSRFDDYPETYMRQWQGNSHTMLRVLITGCGYQEHEITYLLNDAHWVPSYRLITFPLISDTQTTDSISIQLELYGLRRLGDDELLGRGTVNWPGSMCP